MHSIRGPRSGIWLGGPDNPAGMSPNDFYLQNDIGGPDGAGAHLVAQGLLSRATLGRLVALWRARLDELKDHPPVLVHANPTPWSIYLERKGADWRVSYLGDAGECLWWDAAYDLALLRWPPLADRGEADWQALADAYGPLPAQDRLLLYHLMQRLLTASWAYMGPQTPANDAWLAACRADLDRYLNEVMDRL